MFFKMIFMKEDVNNVHVTYMNTFTCLVHPILLGSKMKIRVPLVVKIKKWEKENCDQTQFFHRLKLLTVVASAKDGWAVVKHKTRFKNFHPVLRYSNNYAFLFCFVYI